MQNRWKKEERKFDARKRDEDVFLRKKRKRESQRKRRWKEIKRSESEGKDRQKRSWRYLRKANKTEEEKKKRRDGEEGRRGQRLPDDLDEFTHVDMVWHQELGLVQYGELLFSFISLNDHLQEAKTLSAIHFSSFSSFSWSASMNGAFPVPFVCLRPVRCNKEAWAANIRWRG